MKANIICSVAVIALLGGAIGYMAHQKIMEKHMIVLKTMGSFFFGGTTETTAEGETFHGDHGYAQYYIPQKAHNLPIVMWHGIEQSGRTFETTPDGREGYQAILPRRGWAVYLVDQPRRGRAGRTMAAKIDHIIPTTSRESEAWNAFRNGIWQPPHSATVFANSRFPLSPEAVNQFFRQQTPDTGATPNTPEHREFIGKSGAALFDMIGEGILLTHSAGGRFGWEIAIRAPDKVKAVVAYEPGGCPFPEGENPEDFFINIPLVAERLKPYTVTQEQFAALTKMPIMIVWGDNISDKPSNVFNGEVWRVARKRSEQFAAAINRHGGNARVVSLPDIGIHGNTHAAFADMNNLEIADQLEDFLRAEGLITSDKPHQGPRYPERTEYTIPLQLEKITHD